MASKKDAIDSDNEADKEIKEALAAAAGANKAGDEALSDLKKEQRNKE